MDEEEFEETEEQKLLRLEQERIAAEAARDSDSRIDTAGGTYTAELPESGRDVEILNQSGGEAESLLPRTDMDNASVNPPSPNEVMIGGAGLGAMGFYNQTGRIPKPVINTSSPVPQTFQPPAVRTPTSLTPTAPTSLLPQSPTSLVTTRPTTLTNIPRATPNYNVNYGGSIPGGAARFMKGAGIGSLLYTGADIATEKLTGRGLNQRIGEDVLAPMMGADVFQNAEAIDKSMQMQADFRNETARLDAEAARQKEISDLIGSIPGEMALEKLRQDSPANLQEAYGESGALAAGIAPQYGQASDAAISAQREQRMFDLGSQFESSYKMPDGTFEGRLRDGTKRTMTPEELEAMRYSQTLGGVKIGDYVTPPLGEYQAVPGTEGSVRLPMAPAPATSPLIGSSTQVAPAPTQLIGTGTDFTPEEQNLIDNNPFLPADGNASASRNNNSRQVTYGDANNPAFEGMSAAEIVDAVNAPGYFTPTGPASLNVYEPTTSRAKDIYTGYTNLVGGTADMLVAGGKGLVAPVTVGYDYLFNTPDDAKPSLKDSLQRVGEDIAEIKNFPIQSKFKGDIKLDEQRAAQNKRNAEFLAREPSPAITNNLANAESQTNVPVDVSPGEEGSAQRRFYDRLVSGSGFTEAEIQNSKEFANKNGGTFNPQTGFTFLPPDIGQQSRGEIDIRDRTEPYRDNAGQLRYRYTKEASEARGAPPNVQLQPPSELARDNTAPFMFTDEIKNQKPEGYVGFEEAKQMAKGILAQQSSKKPTASQVNSLAQSLMVSEPERRAKLDTANQMAEARLKELKLKIAETEAGGSEEDKLRTEVVQLELENLRRKGLPDNVRVVKDPSGVFIVYNNNEYKGFFQGRESTEDALRRLKQVGSSLNATTPEGTAKQETRKIINSPEEYAELAPGTQYTDSYGNPATKPL